MPQNDYQTDTQAPIDHRMFNNDPREATNTSDRYPISRSQAPRKHSTRNKLLLCVLALIIAAGILELTGGVSFTSMQKTLPTRTFALNGRGALIINDGSGTFHIHAGNTNQVIIQGTEYAYGLVSNLNSIRVQYEQQGNTVTLDANEGWGLLGNSGADFTITVPTDIDVTLHGGSTDVDMTQINGQINAATGSGNLNLNSISGALKLSTGSGNIGIADAHGSVNAQVASGNIRLDHFSGPVDLSTASGDITLEQAQISGQDHLQTASGNIRFDGSLDPLGTYQMNTSSGDVTLTLPASTSFQLTTSTSSGDVNNEFGSTTTGSTPRATLIVKTSSGNIHLQKQ